MSDINFLLMKAFRDRVNKNYGKQINIDFPRKSLKYKSPNIDRWSEDRTVIKLVIPYASLTGRNDIAPAHIYVNAIENLFRKIKHLIIRAYKNEMKNEKVIILNAPENYQDSLNFNMLLGYLKEYELEEI